jgi:hypothetical protein
MPKIRTSSVLLILVEGMERDAIKKLVGILLIVFHVLKLRAGKRSPCTIQFKNKWGLHDHDRAHLRQTAHQGIASTSIVSAV